MTEEELVASVSALRRVRPTEIIVNPEAVKRMANHHVGNSRQRRKWRRMWTVHPSLGRTPSVPTR